LQSRVRHAIPAYDFWRPYFVNACAEAGIECLEVPDVDWAEGLVHVDAGQLTAWRTRTWEAVIAFVRRQQERAPIDCFLGYLYPNQIDVDAVTQLQSMGVPCVNFFCDNVREFREVPVQFRAFALNWVPEHEALSMYRRAGLPYLHAPMPCWVPPALRSPAAIETEPPTFIGSADSLRRNLLGRAVQAGAEIIVRGPGWATGDAAAPSRKSDATRRRLGARARDQIEFARTRGITSLYYKFENRFRPLDEPQIDESMIVDCTSPDEYVRVTRGAQTVLGVNRVPTAGASHHRPLKYSRLRDIEAPMLGACYLTEWTEGLDALYAVGEEVESYRTVDELCAKLDELRRDPARRSDMRRRAQRRALADHSAVRSLERIGERLAIRRRP
jgi:hypothetical protein